MEKIDTLLTGGTVVTMNRAFEIFAPGAVAIRGQNIVAVGKAEALAAAYQADTVVDCTGKIVMPGLVNAHTHVPMTLLRGLADDLRLDVWLLAYVMPTEREFVTPEFCRLGTTLACAEMIRSGVTAFADMYYFEEEIAAATAKAGMRGVLGQTVIKFPVPDAGSFEEGLGRARAFIEQWRGHELITPAVAPHAPYSNTDDILKQCVDTAVEFDVPLLIHIAETKFELDESLEQFGMSVVRRVKNIDLFRAKVLAAHCVHISQGEMDLLRDGKAGVAHCPTSNLKLASGIAPVTQMLKAEITVGIGTDGPASNNDLDMFEEMRLAAILAKTDANDPTVLPARTALLMATRQGAEALFIGDKTGSLEAGKRADVIVMDARTLHNMPQFQRDEQAIYSQIVYAGHASDVRHVWCDGQWLMRDRALLTIDEEAVLNEAEVYARRVDQFMSQREESVLSKLVAVSDLEQSESFEVQVKLKLHNRAALDALLASEDIQIVKAHHYRQYDTYFLFDDPQQGRVRYREDDFVDAHGQVTNVRTRLTLTMPTKEREFNNAVLLSYSRFIAEANRPLRFYREYFRPSAEREVQKDRQRWHVLYRGVLIYINLDTFVQPALDGLYLEIKSRTWSAMDAEFKAKLINDMMLALGREAGEIIAEDYLELG
ncbi:MAG: amidohydrolase [Pleurocapsa minor GSE-CHR-MK-17-07R]|jgi:5-methylthioadenosine/S-adenosylhomocysteine deaminase|nr:amidohydrolase [Pleurocapsa minor GSE-CHR-MK 17-07R]